MPFIDAVAIRSRLSPGAAVDALAGALTRGLEPASAIPRSFAQFAHGELLLMPGEFDGAAGVKVATVSQGNTARGLPRIQGLYILLDAETLAPRALLDGIELTALRTPAVSLLAVRDRLRASSHALNVVVAGTSVQAVRHVNTTLDVLRDVRPVPSITYLSRRPEAVKVPRVEGADVRVVRLGSIVADTAITRAGLVVCATSASEPLFDGSLVSDEAAVVAIGSHEPQRRELDEKLMARSTLVVEDVGTAMREAGDVVQAVQAGVVDVSSLISLESVVADPRVTLTGRPLVFKSCGMGWQDVVVADAVMQNG